jgi:murein DD-endopeptidase MepM/ murein hydrolase activator NlpD
MQTPVLLASRLALPSLACLALATLGAGAPSPFHSAPRAPAGDERHADTSRRDADDREVLPHGARCPAGSLPDGDACVRIPSGSEDGPDSPAAQNAHHDKLGRWIVYDQIPRRPERPADYDAYVYPIPAGLAGGHYVVSGYDLDKPDESQRRGATLSHVGHGGVDLPQRKGEPIHVVKLEHQEGDCDVVFSGPLFGTTVITRHTLREGGQLRDYVLLYGHLDAPADGIAVGQTLREGDVVGFVGDTGSPELVHLHLEARRVREGIDVRKQAGYAMIQNEVSVVCDPRNVLPLK